MKTTLEMPDQVLREAKVRAAKRGIPLRQYVTEAVSNRLAADAKADEKPWMQHMGKLKHLHKETERINRIIEEAFEQIDPEMWK